MAAVGLLKTQFDKVKVQIASEEDVKTSIEVQVIMHIVGVVTSDINTKDRTSILILLFLHRIS